MTDSTDIPGRRRPGRPPKEQKRIPRNYRFTPAMLRGVAAMAKEQGRTETGQLEFLVEHAAREMGWKLYDLSPAPIEDLHDRLVGLQLELGRLRTVIETGFGNNKSELARTDAHISLLRRELGLLAANTEALTAAAGRLESVAGRLLGPLEAVEAMLSRRNRAAVDAGRPRPRLVKDDRK
jgi:hypothetical protein